MPYGWPLMAEAWAGCVLWAAGKGECRAEFTKSTGLSLENLIIRSPLEAAIDKATGHERTTVIAFFDWVTENLWGVDE